MNTGTQKSSLPPDQVIDRLVGAMAGGNFEILEKEARVIRFRHGTYLTQTATMLPKRGHISVLPADDGSLLQFEIEVYGFAKYWMIFSRSPSVGSYSLQSSCIALCATIRKN
jgi:hypothetical protein